MNITKTIGELDRENRENFFIRMIPLSYTVTAKSFKNIKEAIDIMVSSNSLMIEYDLELNRINCYNDNQVIINFMVDYMHLEKIVKSYEKASN